ncbi:uncharacterized protein PGTG_16365 [Puccinia graminis f. sp. tritici CRL 75-36-700-3]|uniref:Integrase core domain-containing protein n=1 Tax=Puccinia graminis f. sp. tritici (strain CRL 75-36-700-3 / race SCCL) TaxID=418459 RepID=E3L165_PUCGT|nr:uncharacterized protein PGTG_16365 [Puccinia graminis f. sp. tritici CRL 75-36-700-3]EFP90339.2 hypothetical protein PGTG_16365 [Puccinia graminis f. sp. tritici CRL 75-36-700-3]
MEADQTTTNNSSHSGSDDPPYNSDPENPTSEDETQFEGQTIASDDFVRDIVERLLCEGHKGPKIRQILQEEHGISMSASTLTRRRRTWGLRQLQRQKPTQPALLPHIRASLLSSHAKGLNLQEIQARLTKETGIVVCLRTVKRYLHRLRVKLNVNDLALGNVTLTQIYEAINHIQRFLLHNNTGYRRMRTLLARNYNIRIPSPNHVWSIDGHDKLKRFGITVYGFIDAWSREILGLYVHVTNNDPRHIGVYFLNLVSKLGGVPLKVTADYGTETGDVSFYQIKLSHRFAGITLEEASKQMHHTKSTHNQKIEALWSQMMRQHN